jgi:hypothetical protein
MDIVKLNDTLAKITAFSTAIQSGILTKDADKRAFATMYYILNVVESIAKDIMSRTSEAHSGTEARNYKDGLDSRFVEALQAEGVTSIKIAGIGTFYCHRSIKAVSPKQVPLPEPGTKEYDSWILYRQNLEDLTSKEGWAKAKEVLDEHCSYRTDSEFDEVKANSRKMALQYLYWKWDSYMRNNHMYYDAFSWKALQSKAEEELQRGQEIPGVRVSDYIDIRMRKA